MSTNPDDDATLGHAAYETYLALIDDDASLDDDALWLREQRNLHKLLHWLYRPSVLKIGACLFLFSFATSSAESSRQMLQYKLACAAVGNGGTCDGTDTQVLVLSLQQAFAIALGVSTLVALGKVGPLLDQFGRRPFVMLIILCQLVGKVARYFIMARWESLQFAPMVATEVLANCLGGVVTMVTLTNCYVSDLAEASQRTYFLGINMAFFFVGLSAGPLAGNVLLAWAGRVREADGGPTIHAAPEFVPLRAELGFLMCLFVLVAVVLPELRTESARRMSRSLSRSLLVSVLVPMEAPSPALRLIGAFNFLRPLRLIAYPRDSVSPLRFELLAANRIAVAVLVFADCFVVSMSIPMGEVCILYGIRRFGWTAQNLGQLLAVGCASRAVSLVVVSPLLSSRVLQHGFGLHVNKRRFDHVDYWTVVVAFVFEIVGILVLSVAPTGHAFLATLVLTAMGSLASPAINSAITKFFPESKIGEVFGALALVKNVLTVITPVAVLGIYKASLTRWDLPQMVFWVLAAMFAFLLGAVTYVVRLLDAEDVRLARLRPPSVAHRPASM